MTGLIGESDEELAQLCQTAGWIKRPLCRQEAVWRFSLEAMAVGYERAYHRVVTQAELAATSPLVGATESGALERQPEA